MYKNRNFGKNYDMNNKQKSCFKIFWRERMNSNQMKNIIVLKNLPSNIVDEAFIILKNNKKIKSLERIEKQNTNLTEKQKTGEYIVKEAEMVIGNYLSRIEKEKQQKSYSVRQIETRYKRMKSITIILGAIVIVDVILAII